MNVTASSNVSEQATGLVDEAIELHSKSVARADIASRIVARARNREELEEAYLLWQRKVHHMPSWDHDAIAVLRILEKALTLSPRQPGFGAAPRGI